MDEILLEHVDIPVDSNQVILKASIYSTSKTPLKAPWIINCHGLLDHRESYFVKFFSEKFARAGFYVLTYDYRAHGETADKTGKNWIKQLPKIFSDINEVITWVLENQNDRLLDEKIALFGRSLGGAIILTHGYKDKRVKILIPLCTRYNYGKFKIKFPEAIIKTVSAKYFLTDDPSNNERILLAHCKDDEVIPFENLLAIKEHLRLRDENIIVFDTGGHSFKGHQEDIFEKAFKFIKSK